MHIQEDRHAASASGETKFTGRDRSPGYVKQGSDVSFDLFAEIFQAIATAPVPSTESSVPSSDTDTSQNVDASRPASDAGGEGDDEASREEPTADTVAPYDLLVPLQPVVSEEPPPVLEADSAIEAPPSTEQSPAIATAGSPTPPPTDVNASLVDTAMTPVDQQPLDGEPLPAEAAMVASSETEPAALDDGQPTETEIVVSDLSSRRINSAKPATENPQQAPQENELPAASTELPVSNEAGDAEAVPSADHSDSSRDQGDRRQRRSNNDLRNEKPSQAAALQERQDEMAQRSAAPMSADTRVSANEPAVASGQTQASQSDTTAGVGSAIPTSAVAGLSTTAVTQQASTAGTALGSSGSVAAGGLTQAPASGQPGSATPTESSRQTQVADRARLVHRIAKAFQRIGVDGGQVRLKMHPEELGGVQLSMQISGRKVTATVTADGEAARQLLQDHLPELRQRLESLGLTVERLDVTSQTEGGETGLANQNQHQNGTDFGRSADQREGLWRRQNALNDVKREPVTSGPIRSNPGHSFRSDRALDLKV